MAHQQMTQIQIRIDTKTKKAVRNILDDLGLDLSTAIKMFCKQIERTRVLPFDFGQCSHSHEFSPHKARELRKAVHGTRVPGIKRYRSVSTLMKDMLK